MIPPPPILNIQGLGKKIIGGDVGGPCNVGAPLDGQLGKKKKSPEASVKLKNLKKEVNRF